MSVLLKKSIQNSFWLRFKDKSMADQRQIFSVLWYLLQPMVEIHEHPRRFYNFQPYFDIWNDIIGDHIFQLPNYQNQIGDNEGLFNFVINQLHAQCDMIIRYLNGLMSQPIEGGLQEQLNILIIHINEIRANTLNLPFRDNISPDSAKGSSSSE